MAKDGGPDVVIRLKDEGVASDNKNKRTGVVMVQLSDAFWHRMYAGLAMQSIVLAQCTHAKYTEAVVSSVLANESASVEAHAAHAADVAAGYADAMIAHEIKEDEDVT